MVKRHQVEKSDSKERRWGEGLRFQQGDRKDPQQIERTAAARRLVSVGGSIAT